MRQPDALRNQRIIMSHFFQQIEAALLPTAANYAPEGTEAKAVAHQWLHALAYDFCLLPKRKASTKRI